MAKRKKLEAIFNECLEHMLRGESIDDCLERYPEEATELEPLLKTVSDFGQMASSIQPRPEFKAQLHTRLEGASLYSRQVRQMRGGSGFFGWQRAWAVALPAILVVVLMSASTVAASSNALPDGVLYPVKIATEQVRVAFTFSDTGKAKVHAELAEDRAHEIAVMAQQGKADEVVMLTEKLANHMEKADNAITKVEETEIEPEVEAMRPATLPEDISLAPAQSESEMEKTTHRKTDELKELLETSTSRSLALLENALEQSPPRTKQLLRRAIEISKEKRERLQQINPESETRIHPVKPKEESTLSSQKGPPEKGKATPWATAEPEQEPTFFPQKNFSGNEAMPQATVKP